MAHVISSRTDKHTTCRTRWITSPRRWSIPQENKLLCDNGTPQHYQEPDSDITGDTMKITWTEWTFAILFGLIFAGNIYSGHPFYVPNNAQRLGYDLFSAMIWAIFFWSLAPFIKYLL